MLPPLFLDDLDSGDMVTVCLEPDSENEYSSSWQTNNCFSVQKLC